MLDWHSCQICYPFEIKILLLLSKRHDCIAHAINLIVVGTVIKCLIVLQICICVRQEVNFSPR